MEYADAGKLCRAILRDGQPTHRVLDEPIRSNRWYAIRVEVRRNTTRAYCDNKFILGIDNNPFETGRVGVRTWRRWPGKVRFRNIRVLAPDGTLLWSGPPEVVA